MRTRSGIAIRATLVAVVVLGAALATGIGVVFAQPECFDENMNPIPCSELPGDLGEVEGASVDCGKNPYVWNSFTGSYEREFNKFCSPYTNDAAEVMFHGMSVLDAQEAAQAAGFSSIQEAIQSGATILVTTPTTTNGEVTANELEIGGPSEMREAQAYDAGQELDDVKSGIFSAQSGMSRDETDPVYEDFAGIFRYALLLFRQGRSPGYQQAESF